MNYLSKIEEVTKSDLASLLKSEESYRDSWKRRGGVGAFMMLARKWDRIENAMKSVMMAAIDHPGRPPSKYDIFERVEVDDREEGLIDDIRDLRRYLVLVEAELLAREVL